MLRGFQISKNSRVPQESSLLKRQPANQNRAGTSLLGSTQFYRHLVENGLGLICIHDLQGTLLYVNAAVAQALGYDQSEGVGKNLKEFLAPRVQPFFDAYLERIRQHPVDSGLFRVITKSGEERVWLYRNVRYEEVGQPSCVLGHAQDVTDYGQMMKEALDESERRYHNLFENANDSIATFSRDGKITSVNRGAERMLGWPRSELIGEHYSKVVTSASVTVVEERTRRYFAGNKPSSSTFEAALVHKDGSIVPVEARTRAIHDRDGTLSGFQGIYRDITERRRADQAREKFAAMGRIAARVAHEINNPLAGIKNAFRLIKKAIPQEHPSFQFTHLIDKEIDRIAAIVRHMYDLYRPGQEKAKIFRFDAVIHDIIRLLEKNCDQHKVCIILEPLQFSVPIKLPEGAVRQILFNLLVNAIDASPEEGVVEVSVHLHPERVLVSVADHGKGILQEVQEQIFEPFFTTKEEGASGLGLGLSISKDLVEAMGGSLSFQSRAEQGTVFQVFLPLQSQLKGS